VIHGPEACGKTHLAEVWRARSGALRFETQDLSGRDAPALLGASRAIVIEGMESGVDERALFHLFNYLAQERGSLLLTATTPPVAWGVSLADLRSRLAALPAVAVGAPDDALLEAVMVKQFADRQLRIAPEVIAYLIPRLERSLAAVRRVVTQLDHAALVEGRAITVPLVRRVLDGETL
jgi:chromosomal replication initiation ATPase DnaA